MPLSKLNLPHPQQIVENIKLGWDRLTNRRYMKTHDPYVIQRNIVNRKNPIFRNSLIDCSLEEDEENPFYTGVLNTLSNHCVGSVPVPVSLVEEERLSDMIEDRFVEWSIENGVGAAIRQLRRDAARTGIGIAIPYKKVTNHEIKLAFQVIGAEYLKSPSMRTDVEDGIEYYPNGTDIKAVWIQESDKDEPTRFLNTTKISNRHKSCLVWHRNRVHKYWPECASAFQTYPSIRRYFENILKSAENQTSIPMALELDPKVYPTNGVVAQGTFEYQPGWIPTLPPGAKLAGLNFAQMSEDRSKFVDLMVGSAARCIDMPTILALGDSSDSNMATAHIDLQPWKYAVEIDRFDFEEVMRRIFWMWYELGRMWPGYLGSSALKYERPPLLFNYNEMFEHPDPQKRANARATDLESGASTLTAIYSQQGKTARREIKKECKLLGITPERYFELLIASRSKQVSNGSNTSSTESESGKEQQSSNQA